MQPLSAAGSRLSLTHWLILSLAAIGFAFDIYELLMFPLISRPALSALLGVDPASDSGFKAIAAWTGYIMWGSAISGGVFGLLGGYLTDLLGRRRVLTWSILLYATSAVAAGFSTTIWAFFFFRCTTFIGVCVEFVAAVAWLSELFPDPRQREAALGYTQAFSSIGGLLVTYAYKACISLGPDLPAIYGEHEPWRYTLISGLIPALPLILIRPFLPESPVWAEKRAQGRFQRPSIAKLFQPEFARTSILTGLLFACGYGAAFGALQWTPQIVPGLTADGPKLAALRKRLDTIAPDSPERATLKKEIGVLSGNQQQVVGNVNVFQELGGLTGRFALAFLALRIISRRRLLWMFLVPGMVVFPLVYGLAAAGNLGENSLGALKAGIFVCGFLTMAQFSFWGNYLPQLYPAYLRGTGEGFAANVGGRFLGTGANPLTAGVASLLVSSAIVSAGPQSIAYGAAIVGGGVYLVGAVLCWFLPEKHAED